MEERLVAPPVLPAPVPHVRRDGRAGADIPRRVDGPVELADQPALDLRRHLLGRPARVRDRDLALVGPVERIRGADEPVGGLSVLDLLELRIVVVGHEDHVVSPRLG